MNKLLLSGYKTYLGLALVGVGAVMDVMGMAGGAQLKDWGLILAGIGGTHKVLKESGAVQG